MPIVFGIALLIAIYFIYKLFVDGWLFKIPLFFGGWFGIFILMNVYVDGAKNTAITLGQDFPVSWAALVPTILCLFALLFTRVPNE